MYYNNSDSGFLSLVLPNDCLFVILLKLIDIVFGNRQDISSWEFIDQDCAAQTIIKLSIEP